MEDKVLEMDTELVFLFLYYLLIVIIKLTNNKNK